MSSSHHMQNERQVTMALLDHSDSTIVSDKNCQRKTMNVDWNEAVIGWKNVVPYPQYLPNNVSNVIKKRNLPRQDRLPEWQKNGNADFVDWSSGFKGIHDDSQDFQIPAWKANIEQGTCRYVPNNGFYRTVKFLSSGERREWYTVLKKYPEKVSMSWHSKRFQKELKKQLKREFSLYHSQYRHDHSHVSHLEKKSHEHHEKSEHRSDSRSSHKSQSNSHRSRSSNGEIANLTPTRTTTHLIKSSESVPVIKSAPVSNHLPSSKTMSDLYIENFNFRIGVLDDELKRDTKLRKADGDSQKLFNRKLYREPTQQQSNLKPVQDFKELIAPRPIPVTNQETYNHSESLLVKPVIQREVLKPVDKVTPAQKLQAIQEKGGITGNATVTHLKYTNFEGELAPPAPSPSTLPSKHPSKPSNPGAETSHHVSLVTNDMIMKAKLAKIPHENLDKALNSYKMAIETTKQSLIQTLSASKIQRRAPKGGFSSPATIAVCENISSTSDLDKSSKDQDQFSDRDQTSAKKQKSHIPAMLPEIAVISRPAV